jgi:DNA (cytosine-5)-methyltransferase 1
MRYLSVCSGVSPQTKKWKEIGWEPVAFSEIEPFPCAVLKHHYPDVPNLGDMTKIKGSDYAGAVDVLIGGTPCQSFSVAGLRKGLADPRGNLALEFLRLANEIRPKWLLWENVPGVLSSNGGRDFGAFLGALGQLGFRWAYRVLDAQYFGVPQRRRRVFLVASPDSRRSPEAVLFERHSLQRHTPPRREKGERVAGTVKGGSGERGYPDPSDGNGGGLVEVTPTLSSSGAGVSRTGNSRAVRRLMPIECERLMGMEDNYTLIPYRGKPAADGPRYKAIGNSWVVPVMVWLAERINMVEEAMAGAMNRPGLPDS